MMDTKQRIEWIDVAKGIGMLLVILGHTIQLNIVTPLYAFHMPLFFFLSGLLIKSDTLTFLPYVKKMSLRLLRPWIIMLFISFLVCMCIPQWRDKYTLEAVLMDFYTCNTNIFQNSSLWYLPCFFFALMFFYWLNKWCQEGHRHIYMFIGYAVIMLFIKQIVELLSLPTSRLPFKMDTALLAMVFIAVAFWWRNYIFELVVKPPQKAYCFCNNCCHDSNCRQRVGKYEFIGLRSCAFALLPRSIFRNYERLSCELLHLQDKDEAYKTFTDVLWSKQYDHFWFSVALHTFVFIVFQ